MQRWTGSFIDENSEVTQLFRSEVALKAEDPER